MTDALDRAQAVLQREGGDVVTTVTRKMFAAALDHAELTKVIVSRWRQLAADGVKQTPIEFAERFATDIIASLLDGPVYQFGWAVISVDDETLHGRVLDVLFDGDMLTVKWVGGDVVTLRADQVRPAPHA